MTFDWVNLLVTAVLVLRYKQGRRQKNFQAGGQRKKYRKIALLTSSRGEGGGTGKKTEK